jgi:hypothetical protein
MLKQMVDMPPGTVGFEAIGEVDDDDFERTVEPVLRRIIADGRKVRLLYLLGVQFHEYEGDACSGRMARDPEDVHVAAVDFEGEEDVDPFQGEGAVDVEEVDGQHAGGLRA